MSEARETTAKPVSWEEREREREKEKRKEEKKKEESCSGCRVSLYRGSLFSSQKMKNEPSVGPVASFFSCLSTSGRMKDKADAAIDLTDSLVAFLLLPQSACEEKDLYRPDEERERERVFHSQCLVLSYSFMVCLSVHMMVYICLFLFASSSRRSLTSCRGVEEGGNECTGAIE